MLLVCDDDIDAGFALDKNKRQKTDQLEINMHHLHGAMQYRRPLSDSDEILCRWWIPKSSVVWSKILTLSVAYRNVGLGLSS